jgi:hypothetical protein
MFLFKPSCHYLPDFFRSGTNARSVSFLVISLGHDAA